MIWNKEECELVLADLVEEIGKRDELSDMTPAQRNAFIMGVAMLNGELKRKMQDYV